MDFKLLPGMIDTHFHSSVMISKGIDAEDAIGRSIEKGLAGGIDIGLTPQDFTERKEILKEFPSILLSAGCYPSEVERNKVPDLLDELEAVIKAENPAAIGEIGLDWHWDYGERSDQMQLFEGQIRLANRYKLPVVIHNREADEDVAEILLHTPPEYGGIMHCFSSGYSEAEKFLNMGLYISFAGNITYKTNTQLRETASKLPADRILLETDSPYLSPQKKRGKLNHPGHIGYTYEVMADVMNIKQEKLVNTINENFRELFSTDKS